MPCLKANMMIVIALILNILFFSPQPFELAAGDLLIQDLDCGPFCDAVEKVTIGYQGQDMSHIGIVVDEGTKGMYVIEATGSGVVLTPLNTFLNKSLDGKGKPKVLVGRMKEDYSSLIPDAILYAKSLLGKRYDHVFDINNDTYYCSELIYESFKNANDDIAVFDLAPMTFIDPETEVTFAIWTDYYKKLAVDIPEGEPGINPGGISTSDKLDIVFDFKLKSRR